ncbi:phage shock protein operon transcriptional activator [Vibrio salinus]|uniref:phage shock protein operon transcriptional activator n=1 Tax=Vibrio salinus TaxID=2899784 RepID=UPI001E296D3E|nr:phage shock protein operon transcriptional activator [Vibrio salinus]MCE0492648.1 phage shock protein operon transcriptional activator [Vibrio salinus]
MKPRDNLIGESPNFTAMLEKVSLLAKVQRPVLIFGERGSGKELIASRLHYLSSRWDQPFLTMNCAALSRELVDSELFGHEPGAFTGARHQHQGRFERAEKGTLFLDEIATAPLHVQEKLLRVVEYGEFERVGGHKTLKSDVRLITATNQDLQELINKHEFRADLLDRLTFDVIHVPPLRERQEDILLLATHFGIKMCRELNLSYFPGFSRSVEDSLLSYQWPGNVRQLRNVVERAVYVNQHTDSPIDSIIFNPLQNPYQATTTAVHKNVSSLKKPDFSLPLDLKSWLENSEKHILLTTLETLHFNQKETAKQLNLSYHQLRGLIRKYGISTKNSQ